MTWLSKLFRRAEPATETRSATTGGYTAAIMAARESWISGRSGLGEVTATVQSCVSLWEHGLAMASVDGTEAMTPATLALIARGLALRGEAVLLIDDDGLVPAVDWDLSTIRGQPRAYCQATWKTASCATRGIAPSS